VTYADAFCVLVAVLFFGACCATWARTEANDEAPTPIMAIVLGSLVLAGIVLVLVNLVFVVLTGMNEKIGGPQ